MQFSCAQNSDVCSTFEGKLSFVQQFMQYGRSLTTNRVRAVEHRLRLAARVLQNIAVGEPAVFGWSHLCTYLFAHTTHTILI